MPERLQDRGDEEPRGQPLRPEILQMHDVECGQPQTRDRPAAAGQCRRRPGPGESTSIAAAVVAAT